MVRSSSTLSSIETRLVRNPQRMPCFVSPYDSKQRFNNKLTGMLLFARIASVDAVDVISGRFPSP